MGAPSGRKGFAVLLFQDIAVIPILALAPLLAVTMPAASDNHDTDHGDSHGDGHGDGHGGHGEGGLDLTVWMENFPDWSLPIIILGVIGGMLLVQRLLMRPVLRYVAGSYVREIFVAFSILLVVGAALGAFLAGVVLADSEYRHEIEADLEPLKGLLLGVFFMTTGANLDVGYVLGNLPLVLGLVVALVGLKAAVLWVLATLQRLPAGDRLTFTVLLAQGGEFAFVLLLTYGTLGLVSPEQSTLITAVVSLSMLATPLLLILADRVIRPRLAAAGDDRVMEVEAAGAAKAQVLVIAIDDVKKSVLLAEEARRHFPNLKILARARNRRHSHELRAAGVDDFWRETFDSSAFLAGRVLQALGKSERTANRVIKKFMEHDRKTLSEAAALLGDDEALQAYAMRAREELENLMQGDIDEAEEEAKSA